MRRSCLVALLVVLCGLAAGCSTDDEGSPPTTSETPTDDDQTTDDGDDVGQTVGGPEEPDDPAPPQDTFAKLSEPGVGGRITSLAFDPTNPDRLFVGGDMLGIAVTNDFGQTWETTTGLASWEIGDITTQPAADGRIWTGSLSGPQVSTDGISWELSRSGMPEISDSAYSLAIETVLVDPTFEGRLLAFNGNQRNWAAPGAYVNDEWSGDGSVWESGDAGNTWSRLGTVAPGGNTRAAVFNADGTVLMAAVANRGVFTSTDGGANWTEAATGLPHLNAYDITAHPNDPLIAWVAMGEGPQGADGNFVAGGIWKTVDGGATWTEANEGISIVSNADRPNTGSFHQVVVAPTNADRLFTSNVAPGQAAVYRSDDGGASWIVVADGSTPRPNAYQSALRAFDIGVHPTDADRVAIGSDDTLLGSTNGGETWTDLTTIEDASGFFSGRGYSGLVSTDIVFHPSDPDEAILLGFDGGNFIQTIDGGVTWRRTVQDISAWGGAVEAAYSASDPDRIYVLLGQFSDFRGIGVSTNGGTSFGLSAGASAGLPEVGNVAGGSGGITTLDDLGTDVVLAVVGNELYRSANSGGSFSVVPSAAGARDVAVNPSGTVYATTADGVLVSSDGGQSFAAVAGAPAGLSTLYASASERNAIYGVAFRDGDGGAYKFDGTTWTRIFDDRFAHGIAIDPTNPMNIAIVTHEPAFHDISFATGVHLSDDGGETWTGVVDGLPMTRLRTAEFSISEPDRLVVGTTGRGFYDISFADALARSR